MFFEVWRILAAETSILPGDMCVAQLLMLILNILVYGLGAAAVLGVIVAGIMYMTARDNEQQVVKAKKRLYEVVIGLVAWAVMYAAMQWLIPGGLDFNKVQCEEVKKTEETKKPTSALPIESELANNTDRKNIQCLK